MAVREPGGGLIARRSAGPTWTDAAAGFHAPPGWPVRESEVLKATEFALTPILLLGPRGLDAHINLSLHLEVRRPRSKRGGGDPPRSGRELQVAGRRAKGLATAEGREGRYEGREGGRTRPKRLQRGGSCRSGRKHRSVPPRRCRGAAARAPKVSLGVTVSHHCKAPGQRALRRLVCTCSVRYGLAQGCGRGPQAPGRAAGGLGWAGQGKAALASGSRASQEGCAGCGAPRRGGQAATRAIGCGALTARAASMRRLVRGGPIGSHNSPAKGVASTPRPPPKLWGRALAASTKSGLVAAAAARLWPARSPRVHTHRVLKPF